MRAVAAVLVLLLAALPAGAQSDISPTGATAKPAAQTGNDAATGSEGATRLAAAAARKRAPTPPGPARDTVLALTYCVVVFSVLVQGLTIGAVTRRVTRPRPVPASGAAGLLQ